MPLSISLAGRTVTPTSGTTTTTSQSKNADLGLIRGVVGDILNNQSKSTEYTASSAAQQEKALGYDAEIASYGSSERLANLYAVYSGAIGDIQGIQAQRETASAIGKQRAAVAGSGFSDSADIVRSSLQTGYLQEQMVRTQANFDTSGYLEQASASQAQSTAAGAAQQAALDTGAVYDTAASQARSYAANATTALSGYLSKFNTNTTAEGLTSGENVGTDLALAPRITDTTTTGSTSEGTPQFIAAAGTHAGDGYYVGPEDSPSGIINGGGTSLNSDQLSTLGINNPTGPQKPVAGTLIRQSTAGNTDPTRSI